jgi:hypothetical protein
VPLRSTYGFHAGRPVSHRVPFEQPRGLDRCGFRAAVSAMTVKPSRKGFWLPHGRKRSWCQQKARERAWKAWRAPTLGGKPPRNEASWHRPNLSTAQVTAAVYDTPTGRAKLIPQGSRLIGTYDSQVAFGQSRVLLVWTRLITPNGRSVVLERQQGVDAGGYSGLEDEVDHHWVELFKAVLLSTVLGVGSELGSDPNSGSNTNIIQALRLSTANSLNQTGQQAVRRNLSIQPTLTIRPGFPVSVLANRDLILEPHRG